MDQYRINSAEMLIFIPLGLINLSLLFSSTISLSLSAVAVSGRSSDLLSRTMDRGRIYSHREPFRPSIDENRRHASFRGYELPNRMVRETDSDHFRYPRRLTEDPPPRFFPPPPPSLRERRAAERSIRMANNHPYFSSVHHRLPLRAQPQKRCPFRPFWPRSPVQLQRARKLDLTRIAVIDPPLPPQYNLTNKFTIPSRTPYPPPSLERDPRRRSIRIAPSDDDDSFEYPDPDSLLPRNLFFSP